MQTCSSADFVDLEMTKTIHKPNTDPKPNSNPNPNTRQTLMLYPNLFENPHVCMSSFWSFLKYRDNQLLNVYSCADSGLCLSYIAEWLSSLVVRVLVSWFDSCGFSSRPPQQILRWVTVLPVPPQYFTKPPRSTQAPILREMGNEYQPEWGDAL